ncbi:MAG TPA: MFS transporter [Methylomirabilota bacterium]|nr:MFS transporter [Methylomirabilota bacterium]
MDHSRKELTAAGALPPEGVGLPDRNETVGPHTELVRSAFLIGVGVFATTLAQPAVIKLPLQNLLKTDLHIRPEGMAVFFALSALAWYVKPLAGLLSDSVPLFGTRRRHYLLVSAAAATVLWLLVAVVPRSYASLLSTVVAMNAMLVMGSTVVGGLMVEAGQRYGATGLLTSARYFVMNVCVLLGGPLGGFLAARSFALSTAVCGAVAFSVVPVAILLLHESPAPERGAEVWANAWAHINTLVRSGTLWSAAGLLFLVYISPGFGTPLYYYQTDTLGFSQQFIGNLGFINGVLGLLGAVVYGLLCRRLSLRPLLVVGIVCSAISTLFYLFYRSMTAALFIEGGAGLFATLAEVPLMDLAARATPRGSESLGFAIMMSVRNGALALSDIVGSMLIDQYRVSFFSLVWLNAGTTAVVLLVIPFLPHVLVNRRDGEAAAH